MDFKHPAGFLIPVIDINRCEGKGPCVDACPVSVFETGVLPPDQRKGMTLIGKIKGYAHSWKQALIVNGDACRGCGLCVSVCPEKAITLTKNQSSNI
jgi:4Fe-4S ferredoxin